jgi:hypothetical protein
MSPAPLAHETFKTVVTVITFAAALWALYDIVKMRKLRGKDPSDPLVKDERFGYYMGIVIGLFTISGLLRYQGIL